MSARCSWCVGFIRRDCTTMERCVQTGMRRPNRDRVPSARAAVDEGAK